MMMEPPTRLHKAAEYRRGPTTRPFEAARTILIRRLPRLPMPYTRTPSTIAPKISHPKLSVPAVTTAVLLSGRAFPSTIQRNAPAQFTGTSRWRATAPSTCRTIRAPRQQVIREWLFRLIMALLGMNSTSPEVAVLSQDWSIRLLPSV